MSVLQWCRADLGNTIATDGNWLDQSSNAAHYAQATSANRPAQTASDPTLNNLPTMTFDGSNDIEQATITLVANTWIRIIAKQVTWTNTHRIFGGNSSGTARFVLRQDTASPDLQAVGAAAGPDNAGLAVGSWGRVEVYFSGTASDYVKAITTTVTGSTSTTGTATSFQVGAGLSLLPANFALFEILICGNKPNSTELTSLDSYTTSLCGAGLV